MKRDSEKRLYRVYFTDGHEEVAEGDCALTAAKKAHRKHQARVLKAVRERIEEAA